MQRTKFLWINAFDSKMEVRKGNVGEISRRETTWLEAIEELERRVCTYTRSNPFAWLGWIATAIARKQNECRQTRSIS